ncbi:hypothetical protein H4582DRAFT_1917403, partial [Lactarius indigo]
MLRSGGRGKLAIPNLHMLALTAWAHAEYHDAEMNFWVAIVGANDSLKHLEYSLTLHDVPALPMRSTADVQLYPLWSASNLISLSVEHATFLRHPPSVVQFSRVLRNSPLLESLTLVVR